LKSIRPLFFAAWLLLLTGCSKASGPGALFTQSCDPLLPRQRIALIFPGLGQSSSAAEYQRLGQIYLGLGITPVFVDTRWSRAMLKGIPATASLIAAQTQADFPGAQISVFGFSFGALLAYQMADIANAGPVALCSMSPAFIEDRPWLGFPLRQLRWALGQAPFGPLSLASHPKRCYVLLYADHDSSLLNPALIQHRMASFPGSALVIVPDATHRLNENYLKAIQNILQTEW
jgi:hypothetical protein